MYGLGRSGDGGGRRSKASERKKCVSLTLLQQHNTGEAIIQVPEVDAAHSALIIQLAVDVESLVGLDLHAAHTLAGQGTASIGALGGGALGQRRVELVGPRRAVAVAVAVVIAQEVVAAGLLAAADGEGLVDGREQVLGQVRGEREQVLEVGGGVLGVEAAEQVPGRREGRGVSLAGVGEKRCRQGATAPGRSGGAERDEDEEDEDEDEDDEDDDKGQERGGCLQGRVKGVGGRHGGGGAREVAVLTRSGGGCLGRSARRCQKRRLEVLEGGRRGARGWGARWWWRRREAGGACCAAVSRAGECIQG